MQLEHGWNGGLFEGTLAAWGARVKVDQAGAVEMERPFMSSFGGDALVGRTTTWLEETAGDHMLTAMQEDLSSGRIKLGEDKAHLLYRDEFGAIVCNSMGEGGYLFVTAYLKEAVPVRFTEPEPAPHGWQPGNVPVTFDLGYEDSPLTVRAEPATEGVDSPVPIRHDVPVRNTGTDDDVEGEEQTMAEAAAVLDPLVSTEELNRTLGLAPAAPSTKAADPSDTDILTCSYCHESKPRRNPDTGRMNFHKGHRNCTKSECWAAWNLEVELRTGIPTGWYVPGAEPELKALLDKLKRLAFDAKVSYQDVGDALALMLTDEFTEPGADDPEVLDDEVSCSVQEAVFKEAARTSIPAKEALPEPEPVAPAPEPAPAVEDAPAPELVGAAAG